MLTVTHERGYLIPAFNTDTVDYESCAEQLKCSILQHHPHAHVTILTNADLPFGQQPGYANDWQCFYASPYRQTIKLEADMLAATPIDHWWTLFEKRDVVISTGARDFYNRPTQCRTYRKIFDANQLPDTYSALTYWRLSQTAKEFFTLVRSIFENWSEWATVLKGATTEPTTDVVYAIAARAMGEDSVTLPPGLCPTIVHMKRGIIPVVTEDWTKELVIEADPLRVQTVAQFGLFHYGKKEWRLNDYNG